MQLLAQPIDERAVSDILTALAECKPEKFDEILLKQLDSKDVIVRATAAGLIGDKVEPSPAVINALVEKFKTARKDKMNDARLAILEALSKLKHPINREVLQGAERDPDYIVRRRAFELELEANPTANISGLNPGPVDTGHDQAYWMRAARLSACATNPVAIIHCKKGDIRLELFAHDAPMTVDNFIQLARHGFFNGLTFMRVVPNFVIQGGDPRNDMNGGPGYQIRDEINLHPYETGTIGMALSGKDTGGSQFFITHAPQPHLDGGYTSFGQVTDGMTCR